MYYTIHLKRTLLFFLTIGSALFLSLTSLAQSKSVGKIMGKVTDSKSKEPVIGAIITLEGTTIATSTDENGKYSLQDIPTKSYTIKAIATGYKPFTQFDVILTSGNTFNLNFELDESSLELEEVKITASPFRKSKETPMSVQTLSRQEIQSYPGGNNDIAKVVQSLPGVSGSLGFRNDVIIRGGAPNENVYYLDGIEISNINHFATQGSAGGPVGLLNVSFIEDVTLATSAFSAKYDNPLSGVLQFNQRNGNSDRVQGNLRLGASELAATVEGPFQKGNDKATFIASVRRSYLQLLFKLIDLPFLPSYYDYQWKVNYKINPKTEINFIGVGAIDDFTLNPPKEASLEQLAILESLPVYGQYSNNTGISVRRLLGNGVWNTALSYNHLKNSAVKYDNDIERPENKRLEYLSRETEYKLRSTVEQYFGDVKFAYGVNLIGSVYSNSTYNRLRPEIKDSVGNTLQKAEIIDFSSSFNFLRYGAFFQTSYGMFNKKLNVSAGLRTDMNNFTESGNDITKTLSPRLSLSYTITDKWLYNLSVGRYYKLPPFTILGYRNNQNEFVNKNAEYIESIHYTTGFEYLPTNSTRITLEGFYKQYNNYPVSVRDSISLANLGGNFGVLGNEAISSVGLGRTYGFEFFFQKKFTTNYFAVFAYTFYVSEYTGFDKTKYIASAWDNRHLITFTGGYRFGKNWELSTRARFLGKAPYTPFDTAASIKNYTRIGTGILDYKRFNQLRLDPFFGMDVRIDKKFNFRKLFLDVYFDIQNVTNAAQPSAPNFTLERNPDNTYKTANGQPFNGTNGVPFILNNNDGTLLPSIGLIIEF